MATADPVVIAAIEAEFTEEGLPTDILPLVLQAIDAAGYELQPTGGGTAVVVTSSVAATVTKVEGRPGTFIVAADLGGGLTVRWLEISGAGSDGGVLRVGLGSATAAEA